MKFGVGTYKTEGGFEAVVARLSQIGVDWALKGAIKCPQTGALVLTYWNLSGVSIGVNHPSCNLQETNKRAS